MIEIIQFNQLFGFAEVDALIQEMLLSRDDNQSMRVYSANPANQEGHEMSQQSVNYIEGPRGIKFDCQKCWLGFMPITYCNLKYISRTDKI